MDGLSPLHVAFYDVQGQKVKKVTSLTRLRIMRSCKFLVEYAMTTSKQLLSILSITYMS